MEGIVEFVKSLSLTGYLLIGLCIMILINIRKLITLRSPLDTWQHKFWKNMGGTTKPEHLENKNDEF